MATALAIPLHPADFAALRVAGGSARPEPRSPRQQAQVIVDSQFLIWRTTLLVVQAGGQATAAFAPPALPYRAGEGEQPWSTITVEVGEVEAGLLTMLCGGSADHGAWAAVVGAVLRDGVAEHRAVMERGGAE